MEKIRMPKGAQRIIDRLYESGEEAFIVGGCVRDACLGRVADDFDITTSASPERVKSLFSKTIDTGIKHGTVSVIEEGELFEVTTYRIDGEYIDNRHPETVYFTKNLVDDLARRDFTVNAMAYNHRCGIVDAFGGRDDLEAGVLRAVGDPEKRFSEDALRILRGIRFSAVLGFSLEEQTKRAAKALSPNLRDVSAERIYTEWKKLIGGTHAYEVLLEYRDIISVFLPEIDNFRLPPEERFSSLSGDLKQALLFAVTCGRKGFISAAKRLKTDNKILQDTLGVLDALTLDDAMDEVTLRLYLIGKDDYTAIGASSISDAIGKTARMKARVESLIRSGTVRFIRELDFGGKDALSLGYSGKECGMLLEEILSLCASGRLDNRKEAIIEYIKTQKCKQ